MAKVFISFDHGDRAVAETMKSLIEHELKLDKDVFMVTDPNQLRAGDDWLTVVKDGLSSAEVVLLMLSRRSIKKPWVNFEAGAGWLAGKRVIPVCFGNQTKGNLPAPYSHWQGVNIPDDQHFLLKTVAEHLGLRAPSVFDKMFAEQKKASVIDKVLELSRDLNFTLKDWKDED
ncbi:MAG: hypothetical protein PVSMB1_06850 [Gemmatimonadaceae bacterium]